MFQNLRNHRCILVSGPQRSGTRICAKMVAHDTLYRFIDETDVKELFLGKSIEDDNQDWDAIGATITAKVQALIDTDESFVLHCPPFMPWLHKVRGAFIVVLRRDIADITKSANRIGWKKSRQELEYNKMGCTRFGRRRRGLIKTYEPLASIKYKFWDEYQKNQIEAYLEVEYESLRDHTLWVPQSDRINFRWNQTRLL